MNSKVLWSFALVAAVGCDVGPDATDPTTLGDEAVLSQEVAAPTYYRDIKPILDAKCAQCHVTGNIGGFDLTTYQVARAMAPAIKAAVQSGAMPPWSAVGPLDQYVGDRRLTDAQKRLLFSWVDSGAPAGEPADAPPARLQNDRGLPRVDHTLKMPRAFTPSGTASDSYRCFPLDWPARSRQFITGIGIVPERKDLVHHAIVYLIPPAQAALVRAQDALDAAPGYECLGVVGGSWLTSYEPGGHPQENPGGLGFEVEPGSVLLLQMHYNTLRARGSDQSSVQVMVQDRVQRPAAVSLIMNPAWLLGGMPIPANQRDVVHTWTGRPANLAARTTYDLFWADLHMHTLGSSGSIGIVRAGSRTREPLLTIPKWAFEWQETYRFTKPVRLNPNDQLYVECHFDNTAEKQMVIDGRRNPVRNVNWGERTTDEMCLGNVVATPAAGFPLDPTPTQPTQPRPQAPAGRDDPPSGQSPWSSGSW